MGLPIEEWAKQREERSPSIISHSEKEFQKETDLLTAVIGPAKAFLMCSWSCVERLTRDSVALSGISKGLDFKVGWFSTNFVQSLLPNEGFTVNGFGSKYWPTLSSVNFPWLLTTSWSWIKPDTNMMSCWLLCFKKSGISASERLKMM